MTDLEALKIETDTYRSVAIELSLKIGKLLEADIGEMCATNCQFQNALDALGKAIADKNSESK